jgi:hypothetical protein
MWSFTKLVLVSDKMLVYRVDCVVSLALDTLKRLDQGPDTATRCTARLPRQARHVPAALEHL